MAHLLYIVCKYISLLYKNPFQPVLGRHASMPRKEIEAQRVKHPTPSQATDVLTGDKKQNGEQKIAKRKKQGAVPQPSYTSYMQGSIGRLILKHPRPQEGAYIYIYGVAGVWVKLLGAQGARARVIFILRECIWNAATVSLFLPAFDNTGSLGILHIRWCIPDGFHPPSRFLSTFPCFSPSSHHYSAFSAAYHTYS